MGKYSNWVDVRHIGHRIAFMATTDRGSAVRHNLDKPWLLSKAVSETVGLISHLLSCSPRVSYSLVII